MKRKREVYLVMEEWGELEDGASVPVRVFTDPVEARICAQRRNERSAARDEWFERAWCHVQRIDLVGAP